MIKQLLLLLIISLNIISIKSETLVVGVRQSQTGLKELEKQFWAVSDPENPNFGKFLKNKQIAELVQSDQDHLEATKNWLIDLKCQNINVLNSQDTIIAECFSEEDQIKIPQKPVNLQDIVDYVYLIQKDEQKISNNKIFEQLFSSFKSQTKSSMGPNAQKDAYNIPTDLVADHPDNLQMVFGTGTFGYRKDDLQLFYNTYQPHCNISKVEFDKDNVWKGKTGANFVEGELDTTYISAMTCNVRTLVANTNVTSSTEANEGFGSAFLQFLTLLNTRDIGQDLPLVLSLSLGSLGFDSCNILCKKLSETSSSYSYDQCWEYLQGQFQVCMFESQQEQDRINAEFMKLGLKGVSIFAASGDGGSHFSFGPFNNGSLSDELNSLICKNFNMPVFPTSSPYVTAVGGTQWAGEFYGPTCSAKTPCGWTSGGGGFSIAHAQPDFQNQAVQGYLQKAEAIKSMSKEGTYNQQGRAYPDISGLAAFGIPLCTYGGCSGVGGTSASAPTLAGMFSLINDHRLKNNLKPLGYINSKLYKLMQDPTVYSECFNDIGYDNIGSQWDCDTYTTCKGCGNGFPALKGWDPMTGFGQPKFDGLLKYFGDDNHFSEENKQYVKQ